MGCYVIYCWIEKTTGEPIGELNEDHLPRRGHETVEEESQGKDEQDKVQDSNGTKLFDDPTRVKKDWSFSNTIDGQDQTLQELHGLNAIAV